MKYFTAEWWANAGDDTAPFREYAAYLATVRAKLPAALAELESQHTLHDSRVSSISSNFEKRAVEIKLRGWDRALSHRVNYTLKFLGVEEFEQFLPCGPNLEEELGDIGYWECEYLAPSVEIRMLFVSSAEFRIVFNDFEFTQEVPEA
jgi:hypothetical protein